MAREPMRTLDLHLVPVLGLVLGGPASVPLSAAGAAAPTATMAFESQPQARFQFGGVLGQRLAANEAQWLLRAPQANPGLLEMFKLRDRQPPPQLVPWAGEFVGKYLLSAVPALRLSDHPRLRAQVSNVVAELIASQASDGYLGPFPKAERLLGHWDLWGHYHCLLGLLLWRQTTGDEAALTAAKRAADLVCATYLDGPRRVFDAGDHEMNMAMLHGLGELYRVAADERYRRMMREIERDWERAGDYLRTGLAGLEFFETPRPRWESLHDLQGLLVLYRITGEERYRAAFEHHWRSIRRFDQRNTGGFSSGEQATGNPYAPTAIETCCTIAWMALTLDMLRLSGDAGAADDFELALFNAAAGAQHPSGCWWTYNTPMDGTREASAHTIVFQARAGTPELNCCSVNGPRALALLADWAVLSAPDGLVVNNLAPGSYQGVLSDAMPIKLVWEGNYPLDNRVRLRVEPAQAREFTLQLRLPAWSRQTQVAVNGASVSPPPTPGYLALRRRWQAGDKVELVLDFALHYAVGDREAAGKVSLYRGPLLLAYDQRHNPFDEDRLPSLDLDRLPEARLAADPRPVSELARGTDPWLLLNLSAANGSTLRLCDFASAGAAGTRYRSWLATARCPPPRAVSHKPPDGAAVGLGNTLLRWRGPAQTNHTLAEYRLEVAATPDFAQPLLRLAGLHRNRVLLSGQDKERLPSGAWTYWRVLTVNRFGTNVSAGPPSRFRLDRALTPASDVLPENLLGPAGEMLTASLAGTPTPQRGVLKSAVGWKAITGPGEPGRSAVALAGNQSKLVFSLDEFPEGDYTACVRLRIDRFPERRIGQVFSAWAAGMDDPLRITMDQGSLSARIEAGRAYATPGIQVETNRWYHVAAVKTGSVLQLFLDGERRASVEVPPSLATACRSIALGGNPNYPGDESLAAGFADFVFYARALSANEVAELAKR